MILNFRVEPDPDLGVGAERIYIDNGAQWVAFPFKEWRKNVRSGQGWDLVANASSVLGASQEEIKKKFKVWMKGNYD